MSTYGTTSKAILIVLAAASAPMTARNIGLAAEVPDRDVHVNLKRFAKHGFIKKESKPVKVMRERSGSLWASLWSITPSGRLAAVSPLKRLSPEQVARWNAARV